ncbi:MAG TPA: hypothetical protein VK864_20705, partial [Longimicrobiales bacterium]|nr:hypothetical protein [Longimicrobiales bacterium]
RSEAEIRDIAVSRLVNGRWTEGKPIHRDNWHVTYCPVNGPAVAARGRDVAVAWFTAANDAPRVLFSFSTDAGASFTPPVRIDTGDPVGRVDVQLLDQGDALVSWLERTRPSAEVRVRRVRRNGGVGPFATVATSSAERPSGFPQMAISRNTAVFAWTEPGTQPRVRVARAPINR